MSRINVYGPTDGEVGWFDPDTAIRFDEETWWDGHNHIGRTTGSQWNHEALYRTEGKRWVLRWWTQWQGGPPERWQFITDGAARTWLLRNDLDEAVLQFFGPIETESGPDNFDVVSAGGAALRLAFPTLRDDFTDEWFDKAAYIVLRAAGVGVVPEKQEQL